MAKVPPRPTKTFQLTGKLPPSACANCRHNKDLSIVPYHETRGGPMLAVLILCALCQRALSNHELGVSLDTRVAGQEPWK